MEPESKKEREFNYLSGINAATAKKIAKYTFRDYFFRIIKNNKNLTYDIYIYTGVDSEIIEDFKNFWGKSFRIFFMEVEKSK